MQCFLSKPVNMSLRILLVGACCLFIHALACAGNLFPTFSFTDTTSIGDVPTEGFMSDAEANHCAPATVHFIAQTSADRLWYFPGGKPSASKAQNPVVQYDSVGTYSVTLVIYRPSGQADTFRSFRHVQLSRLPQPVIQWTASGSAVALMPAPESKNMGEGTRLEWNFGDSILSDEWNPTHIYTGDGVRQATLTARGFCGANTVAVAITTPTVIRSDQGGNCTPATFHFSAGVSADEYHWSFPGSSTPTATDSAPTALYTKAGIYDVSLQIRKKGSPIFSSYTIKNYVDLSASPTSPLFNVVITGVTAAFTQTVVTGATSCEWRFNDYSFTESPNPVHIFPQSGIYPVCAVARNACGQTISCQKVKIEVAPTATFYADAQTACDSVRAVFTNQSLEATSYQWNFEGGQPLTSTDANPVVWYKKTGVYTATLTATGPFGKQVFAQSISIAVKKAPVPMDSIQLANDTVYFYNATADAQAAWNFGDGTSATGQTAIHAYADDGIYLATLTATNGCGSNSRVDTIRYMKLPHAQFSATVRAGCTPLQVQFKDLSYAHTTSAAWSFPGGEPSFSTERAPVVVYKKPGVYNVSITAGKQSFKDALETTSYITVYPAPVASFIATAQGRNVQFQSQSVNGNLYNWNFGDGFSDTAVNPLHRYLSDGVYSASLTLTGSCGLDSLTKQVQIKTTAVETAAFDGAVDLFPNPSQGRLTLRIAGAPSPRLNYRVLNSLQQIVAEGSEAFGSGTIEQIIDLSKAPSGMYFLEIKTAGGSALCKALIAR